MRDLLQSRVSAILSSVARSTGVYKVCFCFSETPAVCNEESPALCSTGTDEADFSLFLLSSVSECLVTSNLAEVKLLFLPSSSDPRDSGTITSSLSSPSVEPDDLLRIESGDEMHPSDTRFNCQRRSNWRGRRPDASIRLPVVGGFMIGTLDDGRWQINAVGEGIDVLNEHPGKQTPIRATVDRANVRHA